MMHRGFLVLAVALVLAFDARSAGAAESTVALWLFDEPADLPTRALLEDQTIYGNDLTLSTGVRIGEGKFGRGLDILGGGGRGALRRYIDPSPLNLGESDWTWEFWINMKATARAKNVIFEMRQGPFGDGPRTALEIGERPGELNFIAQAAGIEKQVVKTDGDLFAGKTGGWHHVALAYKAGEHRLNHWVDGRRRDSVDLGKPLKPFTANGENNLTVGTDVGGWHPLPAVLDEMRVSTGVIYGESFTPPA